MGVSVGGPQGFGKSHTLVTLVETLQQEGHIVTFIPDCEKWKDTDFFVELIASSLGSTAEGLDLGLGESEVTHGTYERG
jgi:Ni2+-binding GTPase involved in maturation of urease and hydrogenase